MVNVLRLMKNLSQNSNDLLLVEDIRLVRRAEEAYKKGIEVILKTQYRQQGVLTVWCAQHDELTMEPAGARSYELPSLSGSESAGVVLLLMEIENPPPEVVMAIQSAVSWFEKNRIGFFCSVTETN